MTTDSKRRRAPAFSARSSAGREVSLDDYRGKFLVLYFYPRSFTAGCTVETIAFAGATEELRALGAEIVGVSSDSEETQCKFAAAHHATFPILADTDHSIARAYGVLLPVIERGKRVTFVIDPEGYIAARFHHELLWKKHVSDAIAFLRKGAACRAPERARAHHRAENRRIRARKCAVGALCPGFPTSRQVF